MTKEWRGELRTLRKAQRKIQRDLERERRAVEAAKKHLDKEHMAATKRCVRACFKIQQRVSILEGRMA